MNLSNYNSIMTTLACALLIWFGSQVVDLTVKLTRIEADVVNIRQHIQDSNTMRMQRDADVEQRLRILEKQYSEQQEARLRQRVP